MDVTVALGARMRAPRCFGRPEPIPFRPRDGRTPATCTDPVRQRNRSARTDRAFGPGGSSCLARVGRTASGAYPRRERGAAGIGKRGRARSVRPSKRGRRYRCRRLLRGRRGWIGLPPGHRSRRDRHPSCEPSGCKNHRCCKCSTGIPNGRAYIRNIGRNDCAVKDYRRTPVASFAECNSRYCMMMSSVTLPEVVEKYPQDQNRLPQ